MGIYQEVEGRLRGHERARERARVRPLAVGEQWHEDLLMPANPPQRIRVGRVCDPAPHRPPHARRALAPEPARLGRNGRPARFGPRSRMALR